MRHSFTRIAGVLVFILLQFNSIAQQKRIYIANDDHTDYMWSGDEKDYDSAFVHMLDWWLDHNDATAGNAAPYRSKWNCDGSFWISRYEKLRSAAQFNRLIAQIQSGQITVPYSPLVATYGGVPAEAVLRGMYYAGDLERRYNIDFDMASSMENQTLPLGLSSLWRGAGAKYCWYGVCDCYTSVPNLGNRQNQIYWYKGLDTNKILLKWYNLEAASNNAYLGGYAEARNPSAAIGGLSAKANTTAYPYNIAAGFGVGWDDLETESDNLIGPAITNSPAPATQQVFVSNEVDFFKDFETNFGNAIPSVTQTFGNEWDLSCASLAEVSARVKRSMEKLRAAEAMAAIVINYNPTFMGTLDSLRKEAWKALGLYWEHNFGFSFASPTVNESERNAFQRRQELTITSYVDQLYNLALSNLSNLITNELPTHNRFFAFNPLGWVRTSYADYPYSGSLPVHVIDVSTNEDVPSQIISKNSVQYLRIEAANIPSVGYKIFEIQPGAGFTFPNSGYNLGPDVVESDSFKVKFTNEGVITSITDKRNGNRELIPVGAYANDLGTHGATAGNAITVESNGPVSVTIRTTTNTAPARTTRITLFKDINRIEIDNQITQNFSTNKTWTYSFDIANRELWHEETGAVIRAKLTNHGGHYATQNARYDWSTLNHFVSVNDTVTNYGISLSNQDCYFMKIGNSTIGTLDENTPQINVLAGGRIDGESGFPMGIPNQGNDNIFNQRFAISTHTAYSSSAEMKKALEHQDSMVCGAVTNPVNFLLPNNYSFLTNNDPGSLIWSVKPAEDGFNSGVVTRIWNLSNSDVTSSLGYNLFINQAYRTTHVETDMNNVGLLPNTTRNLPLTLGHNEMKTYRVKLLVIPLALKPITFEGEKAQTTNTLRWNNVNQSNLKLYELEKSSNGQQFTKIANVISNLAQSGSYDYADKSVDPAIPYYYRLKLVNFDNTFSYSNTILIKAANEASNIIIFPNPVKNILRANFILQKQTRCDVAVYDLQGKMVKTVAPPLFERGNNYYSMSITDLPAGEYIFSVTAGDKKYVKNFFKQN